MSHANQMISDLAINSGRIKKIATPLQNHFGVVYFYHFRVYNNGKYILLSTHPEIDECWFSEKGFLIDPYIKHPDNYRSGFFFMEEHSPDDYKNDVTRILEKYNIIPWLSMIKKGIGYFDFFGFMGNLVSKNRLFELQLNHSQLLKSFTTHFLKETKRIALRMEESSYSILDLVEDRSFYANVPMTPTIERDRLYTYLKEMGMGSQVLKFDSLSRRERECLKSLTFGATAKQIAFELHLSPRTVEHCIERLKCKLDCASKYELFSEAKNFEELGLL